MADLVTLEEVDNALRLDLDADQGARNADVSAKIAQASAIVLDYLKHPEGASEWTPATAPHPVKAATIIVVRCLLDDTEESLAMLSGLSGLEPASSRNPVVALLYRMRDPAMA